MSLWMKQLIVVVFVIMPLAWFALWCASLRVRQKRRQRVLARDLLKRQRDADVRRFADAWLREAEHRNTLRARDAGRH